MSNKHKVAVYGSLRKGLGNHGFVEDQELLGEFQTPPMYEMRSLGGFPGIKNGGDTSVLMEVYEVDGSTLKSLDRLEGYREGETSTFYDREVIETPFGDAFTYTYVPNFNDNYNDIVDHGDWVQFLNERSNG